MEQTVIKLPEETIKKIIKFRDSYYEIMTKLGDIDIQIFNLEEYKKELLNQYSNLQKEEKILTDDIISKYGYGKLNIDTGEFLIEKSSENISKI